MPMRWLVRRCVFYLFALWVAVTLNFLLPRLMPGDPAGGMLARLSSSQIQSNPGIIDTYRRMLGGGHQSLVHAYFSYLGQIAHLDFGISSSNYPTNVSEVIARTLPYSIFLVGVAFILAFVLGTTVGMIAAWRRGGAVDNIVVPTLLSLSAFPAFFSSLVAVYFFGLKLGWFPLQHAYDTALEPGFNYTFLESAFRHAQLPIIVIAVAFAGGWVLNMRTVMINTIEEDYVAMAQAKGLRDRRVMTRYAGRNAILPPLNGFAAQFASAVGGLVFIEFVFSYPGAGFTLQQAALGSDYPLTQGLLLVFAVCVIVANFIMDILNLVLDPRVRTG
jgi:peptide/nickel transport system permease protein